MRAGRRSRGGFTAGRAAATFPITGAAFLIAFGAAFVAAEVFLAAALAAGRVPLAPDFPPADFLVRECAGDAVFPDFAGPARREGAARDIFFFATGGAGAREPEERGAAAGRVVFRFAMAISSVTLTVWR